MKKLRIILCGILGLIVFGLLLPQPLQALLVLVDTPIRQFFSAHAILLCVVVGLIQGVSEEAGYFYLFKHVLKKYRFRQVPVLFGLGRSGLEFLYNLIVLIVEYRSVFRMGIKLFARIFLFGGSIGLSVLDYEALRPGKKYLLLISIGFHAIINSAVYAVESGLLPNNGKFESWFMILFAFMVMLCSFFVYRRGKEKIADSVRKV